MAYQLKSGESIPGGLKRIVKEELESASVRLANPGEAGAGVAIHEARKSVKKTRAALRLLRPELGRAYGPQNRMLRAAGRKLSRLRDAAVVAETFGRLTHKFPGELSEPAAAAIRARLAARKERMDRKAKTAGLLDDVGASLRACGERAEKWPLHRDGFSALAPGIETAFRRAGKAMEKARKHPSPENFHGWRKRVQDHWYQTRLLSGVCGPALSARAKALKTLQTQLGDDHNLEVLRQKTAAQPGAETLIARYQNELRASALALGHRIFDEKPRQFTRRIVRLWPARPALDSTR